MHAYFNALAQHRDVRAAYLQALVEQAYCLEAGSESGVPSISSIFSGWFHGRDTMEVSLCWFDSGLCLVFANAKGEPSHHSFHRAPDELAEPLMKPHASPAHTESSRSDDLVTDFKVCRLDGVSASLTLLIVDDVSFDDRVLLHPLQVVGE